MRQNKLFSQITTQGIGGTKLRAPVIFIGNAVDDKTGTIELHSLL